ncbi:AAA family ATPase [Myxococcus sp. K38C18041901]|uniref:AAA family ATPase n=1 Tax=Myxococcus guangdongensis TaxID=2906760 RepID=UPI0020A6F198|nr:AAA family ATPase [Myxococcus guangdongensis]MCP3065412.1 AAA family ATPase [Myxococcus guangdongensis]
MIDLGGYPQFVYRREAMGRVQIEITFDASPPLAAHLGVNVRTPIAVEFVVGAMFANQRELPSDSARMDTPYCGVAGIRVSVDGKVALRIARRERGDFRLFDLSGDDVWPSLAAHLESRVKRISDVLEYLEPLIRIHGDELVPTSVSIGLPVRGKRSTSEKGSVKLIPAKFTDESKLLCQALGTFFSLLGESVRDALSQTQYLGPLRTYPPRLLGNVIEETDVAGGAYAWRVLATDEGVRTRVNRWLREDGALRTHYELVVQHLVPAERINLPLKHLLTNWNVEDSNPTEEELNAFATKAQDPDYTEQELTKLVNTFVEGLRSNAGGGLPSLGLFDRNSQTLVGHRDVGIGISQVLPVLVSAFGSRDALVAIEQPELHVHPALQSELADAFIEGALERGNTFVLETHSEHLVLRVLRRIREGKHVTSGRALRPSDVAILYVEPGERGSRVIEIPIREDGEFGGPWPRGFFAERVRELL